MRLAVFLAAGVLLATGVLRAQSDDDEDEMDYYPLVPSGNSVHFGLRFIGGPKVKFGDLGIVPPNMLVGDTTTIENRSYDDGNVSLDARHQSNGAPINDGFTNTWHYTENSQVTPDGNIAFHAYSATTLGASVRKSSSTAAGWEVQMGRSIRRIGRKVDLSLVAGFSFSDMNAKTKGSVPAQLVTLTDVFSLNGQPVPGAPYTAPSTTPVNLYDANGNPLLDSSGLPLTTTRDNTTLITSLPISRTTSLSTTEIKGRWQIRGSYYTVRVGPSLQIGITERFKIRLAAGVGMAYVGSNYLVEEEIDIPGSEVVVKTTEQSTRSAWMPAFFADADAEYWLTERTGLYLGATGQKSGSYEQTLDGRTATIDMGTTYGIQSGVTLRF